MVPEKESALLELARLKKRVAELEKEIAPVEAGSNIQARTQESERLLVVDDNEINRKMLAGRLRAVGYVTDLAENGRAALEKVSEEPFDLILLDLMMPGMTGLEVLRELRLHFSVGELPVMIVTARDQSQDMVDALDLGANDYIVKPVDFPVMLARIQIHLNLKRAQTALKILQNELRHRVEERTKALRETNRQLEVEISDRIKAEQALEENGRRLLALSRRLVQIQEEERHHIARELHDEIGQVLTTVKLNLQMVQRQTDYKLQNHLFGDSIEIVDHAIQQVRDLSVNLRPSILDDLGLVPALRWYINRQGQRIDAEIRLEVDEMDQRPQADIEIACFRIVQEAMTNIVKHAQAQSVSIRLFQECNCLVLEIKDDGRGFDLSAALANASRGGSVGLLGMRERAELVGGDFSVQSEYGNGVEIKCQFFLNTDVKAKGSLS